MKIGKIIMIGLLCWTSSGLAMDELEALRWDRRVIAYRIVSATELERTKAHWLDWKKDFEERDLVWVNLGEPGLEVVRGAALSDNEKKKWRDRLGFSERADGERVPRRNEFALIGKDGELKDLQSGRLSLPEFFDLIDTMPMRRAEMRLAREAKGK